MRVESSVQVAADVRDVYEYWTAFEDYPAFMGFIERVDVLDGRLHWVARLDDRTLEWDADLVEHVPEERVTWHALDGRETGQVRFERLGDQHTAVSYGLEFDEGHWSGAPAGVQRLLAGRVELDLAAFKQLIEAASADKAG
jgi:uncharacterized membrane protein